MVIVARVASGGVPIDGTLTGVVGVDNGQQTNQPNPFLVRAQTVNGGAVTVDTGYKPGPSRALHLDAQYSAIDLTAAVSKAGNGEGQGLTSAGGVLTVPNQLFGGALGAVLGAPSFTVTGAGTLGVVFTPPALYVGTIRWSILVTPTEN